MYMQYIHMIIWNVYAMHTYEVYMQYGTWNVYVIWKMEFSNVSAIVSFRRASLMSHWLDESRLYMSLYVSHVSICLYMWVTSLYVSICESRLYMSLYVSLVSLTWWVTSLYVSIYESCLTDFWEVSKYHQSRSRSLTSNPPCSSMSHVSICLYMWVMSHWRLRSFQVSPVTISLTHK
jgi:hypothetical protein